jgi:ABC-type nitrate/sulfonate/bicarbonate transport system permease component
MSQTAEAINKSHKREQQIHFLMGTGVIVLFLILWESIGRLELVNPLFTSSPTRVVKAAIVLVREGTLLAHLVVSAKEFVLGYAAALFIGIPLGISLGWFKSVSASFGPIISAFYATPRVALMPLFIIWFGLGITSKIIVVLLSAIFPLIVNLQTGMTTIDPDLVKVAKSYGASRWQIFRSIALPASVPFMITGLRLAAGRGLLGVIVAEVFGGSQGIGYLIQYAGATFQTDKVFVGVAVVATTGIILDRSLHRAGRYFDKWRGETAVG